MTTNPLKPRLQHALRTQLPPEKIKLWPEIRKRLAMSNHPLIQTQGATMNTTYPRRTTQWAFAALALLALFVLVFLTPQGQAFAQGILQFFTRASSDALPPQTDYAVPAESPRTLGLAEVKAQAGFDIFTPASLPEGFTFQGASYTAENHTVIQQFGYNPAEIRFSISQQPFTTIDVCDLCGLVGASAPVTTVQVGAVSGEYTEGVWDLTDSGPVWRNDPYLKTLRWQKDGMAYELIFMGDDLTQADLVAMAASLQP